MDKVKCDMVYISLCGEEGGFSAQSSNLLVFGAYFSALALGNQYEYERGFVYRSPDIGRESGCPISGAGACPDLADEFINTASLVNDSHLQPIITGF
jgi:hypothetical protein